MTAPLIFGKYEIQHRIAIGGMGEVFYAMQRGVSGFERPVILKSLLPDLAQQKELVDQFLDEARVAATLNHPNVVSIFEVGLWNGTFYIAMEYIRGRNLAQLIRRSLEQQQRMPPQVSARIIRDAALGLDHAHHAVDASGQPLRIVHRDISPQNIMLREDGVTKVVDFGIASAANRSTRTATGMLKGKLAYMAPEQVRTQPMTPLVDQYALGVVFWEMLTGRRLFKSDNDIELIKLVMEAEVTRPDAVATDVPPALADVAMRMMSREASQRFASLGEVTEILEGQLASQTPSLSPAALMRRLGTDDLRVSVTPNTTDNFVITLGQQNSAAPAPTSPPPSSGVSTKNIKVAVVTPSEPLLAPARRPWKVLVAALGLVLAVVAAVAFTSREAPAPVLNVIPDAVVAEVVRTPESAVVDAGAVAPLAVATLTLLTVPPGARLRVDGRPLGAAPQTLEVQDSVVHYLSAGALPGFDGVEGEATVGPGEARTVTLELKPHKKGAPRVDAAVAKDGSLTIATEPWTKVTVDGAPLGSTPINKARLAAGTHHLVLVNEGANINQTRTVVIPPGENVKLSLKLNP